MANFEVPFLEVEDIIAIPDADRIEVARIKGYQVIVGKGEYSVGDVVIYIPEQAIVPEWLLKRLGFWGPKVDRKTKEPLLDDGGNVLYEGKLEGSNNDRVKAKRLRGVISQGLVIRPEMVSLMGQDIGITDLDGNFHSIPEARDHFSAFASMDGSIPLPELDAAEALGITKYDPGVPAGSAGEFFYFGVGKVCPKFDVENIKKFPTSIVEGERVEFTEKIHGSQTVFTFIPDQDDRAVFGHWLVSSKGQGGDNGLALYDNEKNRQSNMYLRVFLAGNLGPAFENAAAVMNLFGVGNPVKTFTVFGETFGAVQDLRYGVKELDFRGFDVYVGENPVGRYLNIDEKRRFFELANVHQAPILYDGPFSQEVMEQYTSGKETVSGQSLHIREGIVIRVAEERHELKLGRVMLKSVSFAYLDRKGGSEFN